MTAKASRSQRPHQIALQGEMTIFTAADLATQLLSPSAGDAALEVDLSGVTDIDTAGLQLMIAAKREAAARGTPLAFVGHSPAVVGVLDLCGLTGFFGDPVLIQRENEA